MTQFLQEAKHHARKANLHSPPAHQDEEAGKTRRLNQDKENKRKKKQWKQIFLPWWKLGGKEGKPGMEMSANMSDHVCDGRRGIFNPKRKEDKDMPYMCLRQLVSPRGGQSYGPVYMV